MDKGLKEFLESHKEDIEYEINDYGLLKNLLKKLYKK